MNDMKTFRFGVGKHKYRADGMCVMEAVAYLAGEKHSDHPKCACPAITKLAIWVNDKASDELRNELLLDLPWRIVGTRASKEIERNRAYMAADWAVRVICPIALRSAELEKEAEKLESLDKVVDKDTTEKAANSAYAAYAAAYAAANAAYSAANYAAAAAAYANSSAANAETIIRSCVGLIDRMIRLTEPQEIVPELAPLRIKQRELLGI